MTLVNDTGVVVVGRDEGERYWLLRGERIAKLGVNDTGGAFSLAEERMPAGTATPMHIHDAEHETIFVLEGTVDLFVDGREAVRLSPGSCAVVSAGRAHAYVVLEDARFLGLGGGRYEKFLAAAGIQVTEQAARPTAPDVARIEAAAAQFGTRIVGPPPIP